MLTRREFTGAGAATIAVALIGCDSAAERSAGLKPATLRLNWTPNAEHAMYFLGIEKGFYAEEGIDLRILPGTGSVDAVKVVGSGNDTFGVAVADAIAIGRAREVPVVSVAVMLQQSPNVIGSLKRTGIVSPTDLYGKTVAVNVRSTSHAFWLAFLKAAKLDAARIKTLDLGAVTPVGPMIAGTVDAAILLATNELVALRSGGVEVNTIEMHTYGVHSYGQVLFTTQQLIDSDPDFVRRMVRATLRSLRYSIDNVPEAIAILKKRESDIDPQTETLKWQEIIPRTQAVAGETPVPVGSQSLEGWTRTLETFRAAGLIDSPITAIELFADLH
jgi:NitT/TauT family transport system substrate-binding protein